MTPDSPVTYADFERFGYMVIPNAITPKLRDSVRAAAKALLSSNVTRGRDRGADGKDGFRGCLALNPDAFVPLVANPAVLPAVVELLSPSIHVVSTQLIALPSIPPGHPGKSARPNGLGGTATSTA